MEATFRICRHCGNLVSMVCDAGVPMICCGEEMEELTPHARENGHEKHLPVARMENGRLHVCVGETHHPMEADHLIEWVYVQTESGGIFRHLNPGDKADMTFDLGGDRAEAVYAYCNKHGLWMTKP